MKNKNKEKRFSITLIMSLLILILAVNANAFGVSSPYWDERPLYVQPGEVKEFNYLLQNMVGNKDITIKTELEPGSEEIMELLSQNSVYQIPFGVNDIPVPVKINVPSDANTGKEWQVGVRFTTLAVSTENQPVAIGTAYSKGFKVIVGEPQVEAPKEPTATTKSETTNQIISFAISLIVLLALWLIITRIKKARN